MTTDITASLISLKYMHFQGDTVTNAWNPANPGPSWLDSNKYAAMDYVKQGWNSYGELRFKGLDPNTAYTIEIISSRSNAEDKNVPWQVFGAATTEIAYFNARIQGYQQGQWLTWTDISPDANGEIAVKVGYNGQTSYNNFLNAARLSAVPEPVSLVLMALGGLLVARRRA